MMRRLNGLVRMRVTRTLAQSRGFAQPESGFATRHPGGLRNRTLILEVDLGRIGSRIKELEIGGRVRADIVTGFGEIAIEFVTDQKSFGLVQRNHP